MRPILAARIRGANPICLPHTHLCKGCAGADVTAASLRLHRHVTPIRQHSQHPLLELSMRDLPLPTFPISDLGTSAAPRRSLHRRETLAPVGPVEQARLDVVWARDEE